MIIRLTIIGQPASKANSRIPRPAKNKKTGKQYAKFIKSAEALAYEKSALKQIPPAARQRLEGPVRVTLRIWYASERPDLDESVILDVLQDRFEKVGVERVLTHKGVYRNDRQVRAKLVLWGIDKKNPRAEIEVEPMTAQQEPLKFPEDVTT